MWWDMASARAFLGEHFPWFLPTFDAYPKTVLKGIPPWFSEILFPALLKLSVICQGCSVTPLMPACCTLIPLGDLLISPP